MNLKITAYNSQIGFTELRDEWNILLERSHRRLIFLTWEWQYHWWQAYHPGDLWLLAVRDVDNNDQLVAIAPWFIDEHPKGRLVRSVGCVDVTDYLELILHSGYETDALKAITTYAHEHNNNYDALDFCNIPEASPLLGLWQPILEQQGYHVTIKQQEVCPIIPLPESFDDYLANLDKKQRHEVRRKIRKLMNSGFQVDWKFITPEDDLNEYMERFMALMAASDPEKETFLKDEANRNFFTSVIPEMQANGWLSMSFMTIEGRDAAAYIAFDYNNHIMLYNSGYMPNLLPGISAGIVLLAFIIEDAIQKGREVFDFLRGDETYKYRMGGQDTAVMMLNAKIA